MKIALSGGHLTPALAVIDEFKKMANVEIIFIGRARSTEGDVTPSAESVVIPNLGIKFYAISAGRLQRHLSLYTIPSIAKVPLGVIQSLAILGKEKPDIIISFGSYVALPVVFSGWILGIPTITHEQTLKGGLANKFITRFAKKIALSWEESRKYFPGEKTVVVGNPIRKEILNLKRVRTSRPVIFITGGNQGAHIINETVGDVLPDLLKKYEVVHQTGGSEAFKDYEKLKAASSILPKRFQNRYIIEKWFSSEEISKILAKTSVLVGRSGANTVSETAALGVPAIFIPLPHSAGGEQTINAQILENLQAAVILPQERLTPKRLLNSVDHVVKNYNLFKGKAREARKIIDPKAAKKLVEETLAVAKLYVK
ncbi:MAG: UDP-N-acetylglucosamine--N-acetylmuramyl-(pentapeptide) pyrophosphoryl-undecaprenol N-acetylglucosamine transferase [Candidatus Woykebacteria bacterium]